MNIAIQFGKRVAFLRKRKGISQEKLAELAGLHRTYLGSIERGEKSIGIQNIEKIKNALECTFVELFKGL